MNEQSRFDLTMAFNSFMAKVYSWMFFGLLLTAITSYMAYSSEWYFLFNPVVFYGLVISELIIVASISARVQKLEPNTTMLLFICYSILNGLTLSVIFFIYDLPTLYSAFIVASLTFGAMSLYGYFTKTNLSGVGSLLYFALFGLIITSIINIFVGSAQLDYGITIIGLLLFWALTAYDTQKLKGYFVYAHQHDQEKISNYALTGALSLYLDFINIFLFLLRLFSRRR